MNCILYILDKLCETPICIVSTVSTIGGSVLITGNQLYPSLFDLP